MGGLTTKERYQVIDKLISNDNNELNITWLCNMVFVSRSGFYKWRCNQYNSRELQDQSDFDLILEAYNYRGYKKGSRSIQMRLLHKGIIMNRKKIQRLMRKYNLFCPIRKPNPYKKIAKALELSSVADNLVNREFREHGPRKILLTDITYIFYGKYKKAYLSSIKDAFTKEILAWVLSENLAVDFVLLTVKMLIINHKNELKSETIFHSDQGIHYKTYSLQQLLKEKNLRQSMSRKANCWDNAPKESFYGHMKDEVDLTNCSTFEDVKTVIDDYMDYYNNDRYQWELAKLSPSEYYYYYLTGTHPLGIKEKNDTQEENTSKIS